MLVFSQLGQAVRWSWGMNTLLRPLDDYTPEDRGESSQDEEAFEPYKDDASETDSRPVSSHSSLQVSSSSLIKKSPTTSSSDRAEDCVIKTDEFANATGRDEPLKQNGEARERTLLEATQESATIYTRQAVAATHAAANELESHRIRAWLKAKAAVFKALSSTYQGISRAGRTVFAALPSQLQKALTQTGYVIWLVVSKIVSCLNVPLVAIIVSVVVGSVPPLKAFFYTPGTFVNNTVTSAVNQLAGVAVPLILFVLGGNLCKSTLPSEDLEDPEYRKDKRKMLWCSILCRMLIPLLVMAPFLAVIAKFTPISILDDPIFIIVCFLLTGAPSALQLAQICQVNDVFVPVISELLVQSYVVWYAPGHQSYLV